MGIHGIHNRSIHLAFRNNKDFDTVETTFLQSLSFWIET